MIRLFKYLAVVLSTFVAVLVGYMALHWEPDRSVEELAERWAPEPSAFVGVDGMKVHYRDQGPESPRRTLVLLHGTSASLHTWEGWAEALADEYRVVSLDLPGFGLTGPFVEHDDYGMEAYVRFMKNALDALEVNQAVVAGNSFGGEVAWEMALALPERVRGLVLVNAAGYPGEAESMPLGFRLASLPGMEHIMNRVLPREVIESSVRNVYGDPDQVSEGLVDRYFQLTLRKGNRQALRKRFAAPREHADTPERLAGIDQSTLVLWGDRDRLIPPENAQRFSEDIPAADMVMFEGLGHVPQEEDPEATVAALREFLEKLPD